MKSIISSLSALVSLILLGCGPIKGYPGPEMSKSEIVTISASNVSSGSLNEAYIDEISFVRRAAQVLIGRHTIKTLFIRRGYPENCGMDRELDNCHACREARKASCTRSNRDDPDLCNSLWQSEEMHVMCDYINSSYECSLEVTIFHPGEYIITAPPDRDHLRLTGPDLDVPLQCTLVGTSLHRERLR
jgi:hypothetical protein